MPQKKGPRFPPVEMVDNDGAYLVFPTRFCKAEGCGVQLTSRNRSGQSLLCRPHGKRDDRTYVPCPRVSKDRNLNMDGRELHSLLDKFLCNATEPLRLQLLEAKIVDYGIHALMRCR